MEKDKVPVSEDQVKLQKKPSLVPSKVVVNNIEDVTKSGPIKLEKKPSKEIKELPSELNEKLAAALGSILEANKGVNVITSPLSIYMSFAVLAEGMTGESLKELQKIFGFVEGSILDKKTLESIEHFVSKDNDDVLIHMDTSLFTNKNVKLKKDYIEAIKKKYFSSAESLDFSDPKTVSIINEKIAYNTNNLVKYGIQKLSPTSLAVLVNTIYFKGVWADPFNQENTFEHEFKKADDSKVTVEFMAKKNSYFRFKHTDRYSYLSIPYQSEETTFVIEMAKDGKLDTTHNPKEVIDVAKNVDKQMCDIFVPKFKSVFNCDMIPILKELGLNRVFISNKDFSKITDHNMCINNIVHNACIQVDEEGTEACAFTMEVMEGQIAAAEVEIPKFIADRPFFFHIVDCVREVILFSGTIEEPKF